MRFFLDLNERDNVVKDYEGVERVSAEDPRANALNAARSILAAEAIEGRICLSCHVHACNETGNVVLIVPFHEAVIVTGISFPN